MSPRARTRSDLAFPFHADRRGRTAHATHPEHVRDLIEQLLFTSPGERVMRPDFGCGIHELVFGVIDSTSLQRVRSVVEEALRRYEARIEVMAVDADADGAADGMLKVEIEYRVRKTNQTGNLVFPFYFREGGRA